MLSRQLLAWAVLCFATPLLAQNPLPRSFRGQNLGYAWQHEQAVNKIARSLSGQQFLTLGVDGSVVIWNFEDLAKFSKLKTDGIRYTAAALSADASLVALVGPTTVEVWDTGTQSRVLQLDIQADEETQVAFLGDKLATAEGTGTVCLWDSSTGQKLHSWSANVESAITGLSTSRDGSSVFFKPQLSDSLMRWNADEPQPEPFMWLLGNEKTIGRVDYCEQSQWCLTCDSKQIHFVPRESRTQRSPQAIARRAKFDQILGHALSADGQFAVMYAGDNTYQVVEPNFKALHVDGFVRATPDVCQGLVWPAPSEKGGWYAITGYDDGRISSWYLPGSPTESVAPEWYNVALQALKENDFATLDRLYAEVQFNAEPRFTGRSMLQELMLLLETQSGESDQLDDQLKFVNDWRSSNPDSYAAHLLEARLWRSAASEARGSKLAYHVTPEQFRLMDEHLQKSRRSLAAAAARGPKDSEYYALVVALELFDSRGRPAFDEAITECLKIDSRPIRMLDKAVLYLLPRWYGKPGELARFIAETADRIGGEAGEEMFVRMVNAWWQFETVKAFAHDEYTYDRYRQAIKNMRERYPLTTYWIWWDATIELYNVKDRNSAINEIRLLGDRTLSSRLFEQTANWVSVGMTCIRVHRQRVHQSPVTALRVVKGNNSMSFAEDGTLVRTDLKKGTSTAQWESESGQAAFDAVISSDASTAVVACREPGEDCVLQRVTFADGQMTAQTMQEINSLWSIDCSADTRLLATIHGQDKRVLLSRPDDASKPILLDTSDVEVVAVTDAGDLVCTSGSNTSTKIWLPDGQLICELPLSGKPTWSQDAQHLAISSGKHLQLFAIKRSADSAEKKNGSLHAESIQEIDLEFEDSVIALSKDGRFLAVGDIEGMVLYDFLSKGHLPRLKAPRLKGVRCLAFSPDSKSLLVGGNSGYVITYGITRFTRPLKRAHWDYPGGSLEQQPDGTWVETSGDDRFEYVEKQRTLFLIDLYDPDRKLWMRLISTELLKLTKENPVWTRVQRGKWKG